MCSILNRFVADDTTGVSMSHSHTIKICIKIYIFRLNKYGPLKVCLTINQLPVYRTKLGKYNNENYTTRRFIYQPYFWSRARVQWAAVGGYGARVGAMLELGTDIRPDWHCSELWPGSRCCLPLVVCTISHFRNRLSYFMYFLVKAPTFYNNDVVNCVGRHSYLLFISCCTEVG